MTDGTDNRPMNDWDFRGEDETINVLEECGEESS